MRADPAAASRRPADADLDAHGRNRVTLRKGLEAEIVVAFECEAVAVIGLGLMRDQLCLCKHLDHFEGAAALEACAAASRKYAKEISSRTHSRLRDSTALHGVVTHSLQRDAVRLVREQERSSSHRRWSQ